ncbi:MAG: hypothetical protein Q4D51_03825 [Eubacteriales bacterium]|nr:hypothetical protein [Eubacteriales bacterium]
MKVKNILLVCSLAVATALSGCGASTSGETAENAETTTAQEVVQETTQEKTTEEVVQDDTQETTEVVVSQEDVQQVGEAGVSQDDVKAKALLAYQGILKAAPAIEGVHDELSDAGFGYDENMEKFGNHFDCFAIADINQDGVPELIAQSIVNFRWAPVFIYTYADGNAVLLKDPLDAGAHGTFEQNSSANGAYFTYICGDHHIHSVWRGTNPMNEEVEESSVCVLDGTTLTTVDCTVGEGGNTTYISDRLMSNVAANVDAITQ